MRYYTSEFPLNSHDYLTISLKNNSYFTMKLYFCHTLHFHPYDLDNYPGFNCIIVTL